tara:strand:- start:772 stop:1335 length:564 start_codon:yes stop_codon:yes gene_type:complete
MCGLPWSIIAEESAELSAAVVFSNMGLSISNVQPVNYGSLTFEQNSSGGYLALNMATGEAMDVSSGYTPVANTSSLGNITVTSTVGEVIDISCDVSNTVLALAGNPSVTISVYDANHFVPLSSSIGAGDPRRDGNCTAVSASYTSAGSDDVQIGGFLVLPPGNQVQPGFYSTSHTGGSPILFTFTYQ